MQRLRWYFFLPLHFPSFLNHGLQNVTTSIGYSIGCFNPYTDSLSIRMNWKDDQRGSHFFLLSFLLHNIKNSLVCITCNYVTSYWWHPCCNLSPIYGESLPIIETKIGELQTYLCIENGTTFYHVWLLIDYFKFCICSSR